MTEWTPKPDEWVLVQVDSIKHGVDVFLKAGNGYTPYVNLSTIRPAPAPDPLTELGRAVVEAALIGSSLQSPALMAAVDALRAARKPKDAVTRLKEACDAINAKRPGGIILPSDLDRLMDAIAALEAEREGRS